MAVTSGSIATALIDIHYSGANIYRNLVFSWTRTSASGTTSRISWELRGGGTVTPSDEKYCTLSGTYVNIDGVRKYTQPSGSINLSYNTLVTSGTHDFTHTSATSERSFTVAIGGNVYSSSTSTQSGTWTLPAISTLAAAGMTVGNNSLIVGGTTARNPGFSFTGVNSNLWYGLYWYPINNGIIASQGTLISSGLVQGSGLQDAANNWSIHDKADSFTSPSPQVAFKLYTYKASTPAGANIVGYTDFSYKNVTYHSSLYPSFSNNFSILDSSGYYNTNNNKLLKTISSGTATSKIINFNSNATLSSYSAKVNNNNRTASLKSVGDNIAIDCDFNNNDYNSSNKIVFTFSVTDSRGLSTSIESDYTWDNYTQPTLTISSSRNNAGTTITVNGAFSVFSNSYRTLTLKQDNTQVTPTISGNNFSYTLSGATAETAYTFTATLTDTFNTVIAQTTSEAQYDFLIDIESDGTGMSINTDLDVKSPHNYYLNGTAFGDVVTKDTYIRTNRGDLGYVNQADGDSKVIAKSALAFWSGAFNGTRSNLMYCAAQNTTDTTGARIIGLANNLTYNGPAVDYVTVQGGESDTTHGGGYWRWREWNSGKVEIWYNGDLTLNGTASSTNGVYRLERWFNFPNSYSLYNCSAIVSGMTGSGAWLGCGGTQNSSSAEADPRRKFEVMAYKITTLTSPTTFTGVHIYICGEKNAPS